MIVSRSSFGEVVERLALAPRLAVDIESSGLRPYHGDRLFSVIIADEKDAFYFNFQVYPGVLPDHVLSRTHLQDLKKLFADPTKNFFAHNSKFDMAFLYKEGIEIAGEVHCTRAMGRVEYNEHFSYSLDACLHRIGLAKDSGVEKYIEEHKLYEKREIPGKLTQETVKFFDRVPLDIIVPYGCADARGTFSLGLHQCASIGAQSAEVTQEGVPTLSAVFQNEKRLTKTVFNMERVGVRIDKEYCVQAARFENSRVQKAMQEYKKNTGRDFKASTKEFQIIFESEKEKWVYGKPTKTGQVNPSFESGILSKFENPAAKDILEIRDAKSKSDFYHGFLYHADRNGDVHPNYNPDGAAHGRFSSSQPNWQNLTAEEGEEEKEFVVRRAVVPRDGFILIMPDFSCMEYRLLFELACRVVGYETAIAKEIKNGKDPHQATADLVTALGTPLTRKRAKNGNFGLIYGSGDKTLAETIGGTLEEAKALRRSIFSVAPEINIFIRSVMDTAERRGYIFNWFGRRCQFPDPRFAYRAPNYLISGGCADVVKIAMNQIDEYLSTKKSRLLMTSHDELPCEIHESEIGEVPMEIQRIMEAAFPAQYLSLLCDMEWSAKSLADKIKGYPI